MVIPGRIEEGHANQPLFNLETLAFVGELTL